MTPEHLCSFIYKQGQPTVSWALSTGSQPAHGGEEFYLMARHLWDCIFSRLCLIFDSWCRMDINKLKWVQCLGAKTSLSEEGWRMGAFSGLENQKHWRDIVAVFQYIQGDHWEDRDKCILRHRSVMHSGRMESNEHKLKHESCVWQQWRSGRYYLQRLWRHQPHYFRAVSYCPCMHFPSFLTSNTPQIDIVPLHSSLLL